MTLAKFEINLSPTETAVAIDGTWLGQQPTQIRITKGDRYEVPVVELAFEASEVTVNGEAVVELARVDREALADFFARIDPKVLEAEALNRTGFATTPTRAMLDVLREWADGS